MDIRRPTLDSPCLLSTTIIVTALTAALAAQSVSSPAKPAAAKTNAVQALPLVVPPDYLIGVDDVLSFVFWRDKDLTSEATVPAGRQGLAAARE